MGQNLGVSWGTALGCGLALAWTLVACTPSPTNPPAASETSGTAAVESPPGAPATSAARETSGGTSPSAASSPGASTPAPPATNAPGQAAASGTLQLTLETTGVPANATCHGFAQNTGQVVSGGGALGGATLRLGAVSLAGQNEFGMLPGQYSVHISCSAGLDTWEGAGASVILHKDEPTQLGIELAPLP